MRISRSILTPFLMKFHIWTYLSMGKMFFKKYFIFESGFRIRIFWASSKTWIFLQIEFVNWFQLFFRNDFHIWVPNDLKNVFHQKFPDFENIFRNEIFDHFILFLQISWFWCCWIRIDCGIPFVNKLWWFGTCSEG